MERITMRVPALLAGNLIGQERPAPMLSIGLVGGKEEKDDWGGEEGGGGGGEERRRGGLDAGRRLCKARTPHHRVARTATNENQEPVSKIRPKRPHERYAQASKRPRTYDLGPKHG
ncbi:unnamed protein product [Prorocentrum cordatum]|uniref:Uncharacterized protein n=1 Tax=Prorocentrum cordatum TaxID=2364126 RepID=A0ABN9V4X3_9DINO|nr:unnamed protein product [Polarella glacialis]